MEKKDLKDKGFKYEPNLSIFKIINEIIKITKTWEFEDKVGCAWFRGQPCDKYPIPSLFRDNYDEFHLNTTFRNRASALKETPETKRLDKWLFLMQHYNAPTRLLDWTESILNAVFFALDQYNMLCECQKKNERPTIWAIHPYKLNEYTNISEFPNTWSNHKKIVNRKKINLNTGLEHFRLAFHPKYQWNKVINKSIVKYPIAIHSNYMDMRIFSQKSCFTIHGIIEEDFFSIFKNTQLINEDFFIKFTIPIENSMVEKLLYEMNTLGINKSSVYPDIEHFALELKERFKN